MRRLSIFKVVLSTILHFGCIRALPKQFDLPGLIAIVLPAVVVTVLAIAHEVLVSCLRRCKSVPHTLILTLALSRALLSLVIARTIVALGHGFAACLLLTLVLPLHVFVELTFAWTLAPSRHFAFDTASS